MARVLFINAGSEGHINPTLGVVQELVRRGEEVVYLTAEPFRHRVEATGAKVLTYDADKFFKAFLAGGRSPWGRVGGLLRAADVVIPSVLEQTQTRGEQFDYIIHDAMFGSGRLLAQILGLPAINSCTSFVVQPSSFHEMQDRLSRTFPAEENERAKQEYEEIIRNVEAKYHVRVGSPYEVFFNPAPLTIVYTSRDFQPDGERFDDSYKFVGPSIATRSQGEFDFSHVDTSNLIYISLGTVFNRAIEFYKLCIDAFANTKYTVILSVGSQTQITELGDIPENFIVRHYVPQLEVLRHAKLFITHGGMNSTSEGLYYGVPLVVLPQSADQPMIAQRVAALGAGINLARENLTAATLRESAERVLGDPTFKTACDRIGESFRAAGGYRRAVDEIFAYKHSLGIMK
ncbi:macrolide family glycosyltransferase [Alicyclobacillus acidiphilus]|uniref:macrolide family glycosyltransferase n=1 Tax=Alicyclobacillus acidiphilus TaxID=182455 RepID=UPI0008297E27|nr:macrolide family glycosyltransferase [Alicyclobacillus acidiphilus]